MGGSTQSDWVMHAGAIGVDPGMEARRRDHGSR